MKRFKFKYSAYDIWDYYGVGEYKENEKIWERISKNASESFNDIAERKTGWPVEIAIIKPKKGEIYIQDAMQFIAIYGEEEFNRIEEGFTDCVMWEVEKECIL